MFTALSERLTAALKRLTGRGVLSEQDVTEALREIRRHLLEADVSFEVTTGFVERVRERAIGALAVKTVSPGQQVVKLEQKAPGLVAADPYRPAAAEQLRQLGEQVGVPVFGKRETPKDSLSVAGNVVELVREALREAERARCRTNRK